MKTYIFLLICVLNYTHLIAQKKVFYVEGTVKNIDSGKIYLVPIISDAKYYGENYSMDSANISNGSFVIRREQIGKEIYPFRLLITSSMQNAITDLAFFEAKNQILKIDLLDEHNAPYILNSTIQDEMKLEYNNLFQKVVDTANLLDIYEDSLFENNDKDVSKVEILEIEKRRKNLEIESNRLFKLYANSHPKSLITFWKMVERFKNWGYNTDFEDIYKSLGSELKNAVAGKVFFRELMQSQALAIGNVFPSIKLKDSIEQVVNTDKEFFGSSYTLVDFWFTACSPCRKQFPEFKRLQKKYKNSGFQIIGISTDEQSSLILWQNLIKTDSLNWLHFIDIGALQTEELGINTFPTNYLLDSNGRIIRKNVSIEDLEIILVENEIKLLNNNIYSTEPK